MVNTIKLKGEIVSHGMTQKTVYESIGLSRRQWYNRMKAKKFSSDEIYGLCKLLGQEIMPIFFE